tara:strand:+ start:3243 stop:3443 length:201 start_codon:yes stop_codon:yes gene_type:complete
MTDLKAGDLVREKSIRALRPKSAYQLGIVLSVINFEMDTNKNSAQVMWADNTTPLWHPQRRLERVE